MARNFVAASSQYLSKSSMADPGWPMTVACRFRPTAAGVGTIRRLVTFSTAGVVEVRGLYLDATEHLGIQEYSDASGGINATVASTGTVTVNAWTSGVGVFATRVSRTLYLPGESQVNTTNCAPASNLFTVGRREDNASQYFDGDLADIAIWNVALTAAEVALYQAGLSPLLIRPNAIVNYWPLVGVFSPEIELFSRQELTLGNAPIAAAHPPVILAATQVFRKSAHASFVAPTDPLVDVYIGGVKRTQFYDRESLEVIDDIYEQPNTATLEVFNFTPTTHDYIDIYNNGRREFSGRVTRISEAHLRPSEGRVVRRIECIDHTYDARAVLITAKYTGASATTIALAIMANAPAGFTAGGVEAGLPTIDEIQFKLATIPEALSQLCDAFGGGWYFDEDKNLHLFTTDVSDTPTQLDTSNTDWRRFSRQESVDALFNQILVEGRGAVVSTPAAVGATSLFVDDLTPFSASGGTVITDDPQILTYTGIATLYGASTAIARPKPAAFTATRKASGAGAPDETGAWDVKLLFVYSDGSKSLPTQSSATVNITGPNDGITIPLEIGGSGVTERWYYLKKPSSANFVGETIFQKIANNSATTTDSSAQLNGATTQPPTTAANYAAGATYIYVADTSKFNGSGGTVRYGTRTFTYTGRSTSSGVGALTGIPSGGAGSIAATITVGDVLTYVPTTLDYYLTGIPASGTGSIVYALEKGRQVNILVTVDDTTSQSTYGIRRKHVQDQRLSITAAQTRGEAELTLQKDPRVTGSYTTTDYKTRTGRSITISMAASWGINGTYVIQKVRKYFELERVAMQRDVTYSNQTLDRDLFRILREMQRNVKAVG